VGVHSGESEWGNIGVVEKLAPWAGLLGLIIKEKSTFLGIYLVAVKFCGSPFASTLIV